MQGIYVNRMHLLKLEGDTEIVKEAFFVSSFRPVQCRNPIENVVEVPL